MNNPVVKDLNPLFLLPCQLAYKPIESIGPVDKIQVIDAHECAPVPSITAPFAAGDTNQSVIWALDVLQNPMGLTEYGEPAWMKQSSV